MLRWSLAAGFVGVLASWIGLIRLERSAAHRPAEQYWLVGLAALLPAWLIAFLGLLPQVAGRFPERAFAPWWILSSTVAILGVIVADAAVRRLQTSGKAYRPARYWVVGVGTFFAAWSIALLGLVWSVRGHPP